MAARYVCAAWLLVRAFGQRPAADAAPGKAREQVLSQLLIDRALGAQPVSGTDLRHPDQSHAEQVSLVVRDAGILADELADHLGALVDGPLEALPDGRLVAEIGLEDQPERLARTADVIEERTERGWHAFGVVGRRRQRGGNSPDEFRDALVKQRQVEVELARKVLVQDRFTDASPFGDLVHRRGVVALRDEDVAGCPEQLSATCRARQARACRSSGLRRRDHETLRCLSATVCGCQAAILLPGS